jgi:hypothetical protein
MSRIGDGPKSDDRYWMKTRSEILWLRSWGAEELLERSESVNGKGVLGQLPKESIEAELLKALLANTRELLHNELYIQSLIDAYRLYACAINIRDFTGTALVQEGSP